MVGYRTFGAIAIVVTLGVFLGGGNAMANKIPSDNVLRFGSVCDSLFWTCTEDGIASLNGNALKNALPVLFDKVPKLNVDFKWDVGIWKVVLQTEAPLEVESLAGNSIEEVVVSGANKTLSSDLCGFMDATKLPNLGRVKVVDAQLTRLSPVLFISCAASGPSPARQLEMSIENSEVFFDDNTRNQGQVLIMDPPALKAISLTNVTFHNVESIKAVRLSKLKATNVGLAENRLCCSSKLPTEVGNIVEEGLTCKSEDANSKVLCGFRRIGQDGQQFGGGSPVGQDGQHLEHGQSAGTSHQRRPLIHLLFLIITMMMI